MYKIVYYSLITEGLGTKGQDFEKIGNSPVEYRLRRTALHYIQDLLQQDYRSLGFATDVIKGGIYCYKSEKTSYGDRKITELRIIVEKA